MKEASSLLTNQLIHESSNPPTCWDVNGAWVVQWWVLHIQPLDGPLQLLWHIHLDEINQLIRSLKFRLRILIRESSLHVSQTDQIADIH